MGSTPGSTTGATLPCSSTNVNKKQVAILQPKPTVRFPPLSAAWMLQRLRYDSEDEAIAKLKAWIPKSYAEIDGKLMRDIKDLDDEQGLQALYELKTIKRLVHGRRGRSLTVPVMVQDKGNSTFVTLKALVDSGSTGSCIDRTLVAEHGFPTSKVQVPIPVRNADGTPNKAGSITAFDEVRLVIGEHSELVKLAVTDLGGHGLFLGHDWLKKHNPTIDWSLDTIVFDRCPHSCGYILNPL